MLRFALLLFMGASLIARPSLIRRRIAGREEAEYPWAVQGHPALLVVCFTHASGPHCTEWSKRLKREFGTIPRLGNIHVVFLEDAPRLVRGMAKSGIKSGVPKEDYDRF